MGEISQATLQQLSKGISEVIKTEWKPGEADKLIQAANQVIAEGKKKRTELSENIASNNTTGYQNKREVLEKAVQELEVSGIKTKLGKVFSSMSKLKRDHSSSEDDEFRALLRDKQIEATDAMIEIMNKYYADYQKIVQASRSIRRQQGFKNIVNDTASIMQKGYIVLNRIAESIHGTKIIYEVQVAVGSSGTLRTAYLSLDQLANYTYAEYHKGGINLRLDETKINAALKSGEIKAYDWDSQLTQAYNSYVKRIVANQTLEDAVHGIEKYSLTDWKSNIGKQSGDQVYVNMGNIIEAFRRAAAGILDRALENGFHKTLEEIMAMDDHEIHYLLHSQMQTTINNTEKFWQGPDFVADLQKLFNGLLMGRDADEVKQRLGLTNADTQVGIQEKSSGASITSLNQLITELEQAVNAIKIIVGKTGEGSLQSAIDKGTVEGLDEQVEQAVRQLVQQFLPSAT